MYYVYFYIDPQTNLPFYIGKGSGYRLYDHIKNHTSSSKRVQDKISNLRSKNLDPLIEIYKDELTEDEAYDLEKTLISKYGRKGYDQNGILMNICEDYRPPKRGKWTEESKKKQSLSMKGKNKGKVPWNKGKSHKRGAQTPQQTILIMKTRLKKLMGIILSHYDEVTEFTISESKRLKIIPKTSPISMKVISQYTGDILP